MLLLDEPTNHLDLESAESLANFLKDFPGTVLFVSHNLSFINTVASHTLILKENETDCFVEEGNLKSLDINLSEFDPVKEKKEEKRKI